MTNDLDSQFNGRLYATWRRGFLLCVATAVALAIVGPASGQRARDRDRELWDDFRPVAPTPLDESRRSGGDLEDGDQQRPTGLIREGALILETRATVRFDGESESWHANLEGGATSQRIVQPREMPLLPNSFLGEMLQVIDATPNQRITFEVSGEVLVYDGRNYMLLRAPARVVGLERLEDGAASSQARSPREEDDPRARTRQGRGAADVMRELERESGPLHRAPLVPRRPLPPGTASGNEDAESQDREARREDLPGRPSVNDRMIWREGALVVQRRGRITRDAGGSWRFVFDADAQGLADPPLTLMPCLLLERIERFARQAGPTAAVLISGEVFVYEGRSYLLPSAFQLPRERTPLN